MFPMMPDKCPTPHCRGVATRLMGKGGTIEKQRHQNLNSALIPEHLPHDTVLNKSLTLKHHGPGHYGTGTDRELIIRD